MSEDRDLPPAQQLEPAPHDSVLAHMLQMFDGVVHGFAHVVDTVPAAGGLAGLVRAMRADAARLREMVAPPQLLLERPPSPGSPGSGVDEVTSDETLAIDAAALDKAEAKVDKKAERYASSKS